METPNLPTELEAKLTRKDFLSGVDPRWCPGCGCYAAFKTLTGVFPTMDIPKEKFAVISGIGCSSRFPYYANTYGFHTIHGRAPTVAMGLKLSRPDLSVWVMTGDGDGLSIGGNHFIHLMRRNPDIKIILFNNQIYGLTKGQASPTTAPGTKTKTTPAGVQDNPMRPVAMALAAGATFVARAHDSDNELLGEVLTAASKHKGIAFVEIMMNCVIFNDGAIDPITGKANRSETTVRLRDGQPLVFGAQSDKAIRLRNAKPEVVMMSDARKEDLLVHDIHQADSSLAFLLGQMNSPMPFGVFRQVEMPTFDGVYPKQQEMDFDKILRSGNTWMETETGEVRPIEGGKQ